MFYKVVSRLLDYPTEALIEALPELRAVLSEDFEAAECLVLEEFIRHLQKLDLTEAQGAYVMTFDLTPSNALHLTHHLLGDDRNRGPALIDLTEFYKEFGLELASNELPDYLPLILEFSDGLAAEESRMFLAQWTKVLKQLASNLEEAESPYAPLIRLVERRSYLGTPEIMAA